MARHCFSPRANAQAARAQRPLGPGGAVWLADKKLEFPSSSWRTLRLSRQERISAEHMGNLLLEAWRSRDAGADVVAAARRLRRTMRRRWFRVHRGQRISRPGPRRHARVGGYVLDKRGSASVVLFINHAMRREPGAQDALLQWVYERGRRPR